MNAATPPSKVTDLRHSGQSGVAVRFLVNTEPASQVNGNATALPASLQSSAHAQGPLMGPSIPDEVSMFDLPEEDNSLTAPHSPYSANRALLRDLTLPTAPNYEIPQSPPGSPVESTNTKFKQFLKLKKQGVHFNEKLANSAAMKNPSLMQKLLDFADIDETEQYLTALPSILWNPEAFPDYAFKEQLSKSQQMVLKRKEEEKSHGQRESIDFVSGTTSNSSSRTGTPGLTSRNNTKSAAERVMSGLDKGKASSPQVQGIKRKSRFDT